ncbi:MAG: hypothetical protein PW792_06475 [Acidobacteriaceae bacterium]|nr:hypothetical protein [Acidobacteriaceae bacterium]
MNAANPFVFSKLFTDLTGRKVNVVAADDMCQTHCPKAYGLFDIAGSEDTILIKMDLALLGSLGGVLVGIPEALVKQQVAQQSLDEMLRDAMHEVLNITSSVLLRSRRAVLRRMLTDANTGEALCSDFLNEPHSQRRFHATMAGYPSGELCVFTKL